MKYHLVLPCFAAFLLSTAYSVNIQAFYDVDDSMTVYIVKKVFELKCNVTDNAQKLDLQWKRDNKPLTEEFKGRNRTNIKGTMYSLKVMESTDDDIGNYSCEVNGAKAEFQVVTKIYVKVDNNVNVVEGETLKVKCETRGKPPPRLSWQFMNETYNASYEKSGERVQLSSYKDVDNGMLQIHGIQKYERGVYTCIGRPALSGADDDYGSENDEDAVKDTCTVRVKDKYAALWPFLGICAEVFVLCLIIFIYEKKRNKTELEESDTDQSPDQKNTPDHGKESNLRHRQ